MFGNAPRSVWQKWAPPDEFGRIILACRCLLVEFENKKILLETGVGAFFEPKMAQRYGIQNPTEHMLLKHLQAVGIQPDEITDVILSHLHFDHAGGLLPVYGDSSKDLVFTKARFWVGADAWARAIEPHVRDRASFIPGLTDKLEQTQRLLIIRNNADIPKEYRGLIEFLFTNGHTPGQMHTLVKGSGRPVLFCGDLIPGVPWVHAPITMGYDRYPELLIDEKTELYNRALKEDWLLFFTHDPNLATASIRFSNDRYEAIEQHRSLTRSEVQ